METGPNNALHDVAEPRAAVRAAVQTGEKGGEDIWMGFGQRVEAVCAQSAELAFEGAYAEALALAWLAIVDADAQEYATASRKALVIQGREAAAIEMADRDYASTKDLEAALFSLAHAGDPCAILLVLDRMLHVRCSPDCDVHSLPLAAYDGGLMEADIDPRRLSVVGCPPIGGACYVLNRIPGRERAKFEDLHWHPFTHMPHWTVLRARPDPASPSISARVQRANASLEKAFGSLVDDARIYLAEFSEPPKFLPRDPGDKERWIAMGLDNEEALKQEVLDHLDRAIGKRADVVVLPELTITPRIKAEIASWLRERNGIDETLGRSQLIMVVAGSFHVPRGDANEFANETCALDAQGNSIDPLTHRKICPVELNMNERMLIEDIHEGNTISLLKTDGGIHALVICLDLAQKGDTSLPLRKLPVSWVWVPSLSGRIGPHEDQAKLLTLSQPAIVACANQGPAYFYPDLPMANEGTSNLSFVYSTRDGKHKQHEDHGPTWRIVVAGVRKADA